MGPEIMLTLRRTHVVQCLLGEGVAQQVLALTVWLDYQPEESKGHRGIKGGSDYTDNNTSLKALTSRVSPLCLPYNQAVKV